MDNGQPSCSEANDQKQFLSNYLKTNMPGSKVEQLQNVLFNMSIAHEIALDYNFSFTSPEIPKNSLLEAISDTVHNAYWALIEEELSRKPPELERTLNILNDIKESLYSVLLPHQTKMKKEISEVLDLDLIKQQAEHNAMDFKSYANFIINLMSKVCAPVRDEEIKTLSEVNELVPALRGIIEVLNKMKLDMINFKLNTVKPDVVANSVSYEKDKFKEFLQLKGGVLTITKSWLGRHKPSNVSDSKEIISALHRAFLELLSWEDGTPLPETLVLDHLRFVKMRSAYYRISILATLLLVAMSACGPELCNDDVFRVELRKKVSSLVEEVDSDESFEVVLPNLIEQVIKEANTRLEQRKKPRLICTASYLIECQLNELPNPSHSVRRLVQTRIDDFLIHILTLQPGEFTIPPALFAMKEEMQGFATVFQHVVLYNIRVYYQYYHDILTEIDP